MRVWPQHGGGRSLAADDFPLFVKGIALEEGGQTSVTVGAAAYTFNSSLRFSFRSKTCLP